MTVFASNPVLWALNPADQQQRANDLAHLVEAFDVEMVFDGDRFLGIVDVLAAPFVEAAIA
jgi:hypothetical protein